MTGQELQEWRRKWGLSQEDLGRALGVFRESVSRWETGARAIPSFLPLALEALENRMIKTGEAMGKIQGKPFTQEEKEQLVADLGFDLD